jgi:hypothetical protein
MTSIVLQLADARPETLSASHPQAATRSLAKEQDQHHFPAKTQVLDSVEFFILNAYIDTYK